MTEMITITNYPADRFARLATTIAAKGLKLVGFDGEAKDFGADVKYHYNPVGQTLMLEVLHGPHLHSFDAFCAQLRVFVEDQK